MVIMHPLYKDYDDLSAKYNLLQLPVKIGDVFSIKGKLPIIDCNGTVWDTFSVRIDVHIDYPGSLPTITETEKRIPRNGKWHINHYSTTGKVLTDTLMEETWSIWGGGITKIKFKECNQNGSVTSRGAVKSKNPHW